MCSSSVLNFSWFSRLHSNASVKWKWFRYFADGLGRSFSIGDHSNYLHLSGPGFQFGLLATFNVSHTLSIDICYTSRHTIVWRIKQPSNVLVTHVRKQLQWATQPPRRARYSYQIHRVSGNNCWSGIAQCATLQWVNSTKGVARWLLR